MSYNYGQQPLTGQPQQQMPPADQQQQIVTGYGYGQQQQQPEVQSAGYYQGQPMMGQQQQPYSSGQSPIVNHQQHPTGPQISPPAPLGIPQPSPFQPAPAQVSAQIPMAANNHPPMPMMMNGMGPQGYPQQQPQYPTAAPVSPMQHPRMPSAIATPSLQPQEYPQQQQGYPQQQQYPQHQQQQQYPLQQQQYQQRPIPVPVGPQQAPLGELKRVPATPGIRPEPMPAFTRSTLTRIPKTQAVASRTKLSFGVTVTPFPIGADPVPVASPAAPILRCTRCRTYLNPYVEQMDAGTRWKCNLCYAVNDFPATYDYDLQTQQPVDRRSKVELLSPVYEFVAPQEYMVRPPQPPAYLFLLDATYAAISSGKDNSWV